MKNKVKKATVQDTSEATGKLISRKTAIKKAGYMAVSAATMMLLLNTHVSAHGSPAPPPSTNRNNNPQGGGIWKTK